MTKKERLLKRLNNINAYYCEFEVQFENFRNPVKFETDFENFEPIKKEIELLDDDLIKYVTIAGERVYKYRIKKYKVEVLK